jgi:hypothetical protein
MTPPTDLLTKDSLVWPCLEFSAMLIHEKAT